MFLAKGILEMGEHRRTPMLKVISIELLWTFKVDFNFNEITLLHGCFLVNLLYIVGTPFSKNTFRGLLMDLYFFVILGLRKKDSNNFFASGAHIVLYMFAERVK